MFLCLVFTGLLGAVRVAKLTMSTCLLVRDWCCLRSRYSLSACIVPALGVKFLCVLILDECLVFGGVDLLIQRGCCGVCRSVYLLDPTGVLYWRDIYPIQVRIVQGRFIGGSVLITEPRSMYGFSRLRVLIDYRILAAAFLIRKASLIRQSRIT